ncbi:hypothetical protein B566_EDAN004911 [Ephemera danica]|nr:hypothetical protein B566_EDAN004911 [Ephemera danica]
MERLFLYAKNEDEQLDSTTNARRDATDKNKGVVMDMLVNRFELGVDKIRDRIQAINGHKTVQLLNEMKQELLTENSKLKAEIEVLRLRYKKELARCNAEKEVLEKDLEDCSSPISGSDGGGSGGGSSLNQTLQECLANNTQCQTNLTACEAALALCSQNATLCAQLLANCSSALAACNASLANATLFLQNCSAYLCNQTVTWYDALARCQALGMTLVAFETAGEETAVNNYFLSILGNRAGQAYWLSLNSLDSPNTWVWATTGVVLTPTLYSNWQTGTAPSTSSSPCVMDNNVSGSTMKWQSNTCNSKSNFVCELKGACAQLL